MDWDRRLDPGESKCNLPRSVSSESKQPARDRLGGGARGMFSPHRQIETENNAEIGLSKCPARRPRKEYGEARVAKFGTS